MRILFYRYHSICETDIQKAFDQLGIEVKTLWNDQICEDSEKISDFLMKNEVNAVFSVNGNEILWRCVTGIGLATTWSPIPRRST